MKLAAVSGSLSSRSGNTALLQTIRRLAAPSHQVTIFEALVEVPPFSPEVTEDETPPSVDALRALLTGADGVLIATPEYAGGVPGALKNALDWLVRSGELYGKAAVVLSVEPSVERGANARASLGTTLTFQGAQVLDSFTVALAPGSPPHAVQSVAMHVLERALRSIRASSADQPDR